MRNASNHFMRHFHKDEVEANMREESVGNRFGRCSEGGRIDTPLRNISDEQKSRMWVDPTGGNKSMKEPKDGV